MQANQFMLSCHALSTLTSQPGGGRTLKSWNCGLRAKLGHIMYMYWHLDESTKNTCSILMTRKTLEIFLEATWTMACNYPLIWPIFKITSLNLKIITLTPMWYRLKIIYIISSKMTVLHANWEPNGMTKNNCGLITFHLCFWP